MIAFLDRARVRMYRFGVIVNATSIIAAASGCQQESIHPTKEVIRTVAVRHPVIITEPKSPSKIMTGMLDERGKPIELTCLSCHAIKPANGFATIGTPLQDFHQSLVGRHAQLTCISCHDPDSGYDSLRLADGRKIPFTQSMRLCAQCHGTQYRDYQNGAHGGMAGYWDLSRGSRVRQHCMVCHDPHAPKYPSVKPAPGPNDRFYQGGAHE